MQFAGFKMKTKRVSASTDEDAFTVTAARYFSFDSSTWVYQDRYLDEKPSYTYLVEACDSDGQRIGSPFSL